MIRILLYHGTTDNHGRNIETHGVDLSKSQDLLDFSKGFYTTPDIKFALKTAMQRYSTSRYFPNLVKEINGIAVVILEYDEQKAAKKLRIKNYPTPSNTWARFVMANRVDSDKHWVGFDNNRFAQYDIIAGPTADGKLDDTLISIEKGMLRISDVTSNMCQPAIKGAWAKQISFHTVASLGCITVQNVVYLDWKEE